MQCIKIGRGDCSFKCTKRHGNRRNKIDLQNPSLQKQKSINYLTKMGKIILKKLSAIPDNTDRQLDKIREQCMKK